MPTSGPMEMWGGVECTIARIGDRYRDEVVETGHFGRQDDLDRVAELGIRTIRYPVLWEAVRRDGRTRNDWSWHDRRMAQLQALGLEPIVGLLHHGSGPRFTDLLDPAFPQLFARYAAAVARRYPWVGMWTPVNEPLTTARFSALYGHWYPHGRGYGPFLRALVNQCLATAFATRAIRRENPAARLVQTDDIGRVFATAPLAYQAEHENERRWLTFDILFGRLDEHHPWWRICVDHGIQERELAWLRDNPTPPDLVGVNHYLTSERFLDERLSLYPAHLHGGNGRDRYADVEAVRVPLPDGECGPAARLREVWERYRVPIAVTEAHHGSTRDEQLRWLIEVWRAAEAVRREGADIRAVTAWALFGTVDWNALLTRENRIYEPGAFDIRVHGPRPTLLATAIRSLAQEGAYDHPVLDVPGWWRRDGRHYQRHGEPRPEGAASPDDRILLILDHGTALGATLSRVARARGLAHEVVEEAPLASQARVWGVVDVTGDRVGDEASSVPVLSFGPEGASATGALLRVEMATPFGPDDRDNLVWRTLQDLAIDQSPAPHGSEPFHFSYLPDVAHVAFDLLLDGVTGVHRLVNPGALSRDELVAELAHRTGLAERATLPILPTERAAPFPMLPPVASALDRYLAACGSDWRRSPAMMGIAAE